MKPKQIKIKNLSLKKWKELLESELKPPVIVSLEEQHVLEAFLELVNHQLKNS